MELRKAAASAMSSEKLRGSADDMVIVTRPPASVSGVEEAGVWDIH